MEKTDYQQEAAKEISNQVDAFLFETLKAKPEDLKTREDLKKFSFTCPWCKQTKPATELIIVEATPMAPIIRDMGDKIEVTFHRKIGVCCQECSIKIQVSEKSVQMP